MIELTALTETGLNANTAVELRKAAAELGIKGASKGRKADLIAEIMKLVEAAKEAAQVAELQKIAKAPIKKTTGKGTCEDCSRKVNKKIHPDLCPVCYDYAGWENTHNDAGHEALADSMDSAEAEETTDCPVCHPELDRRKVKATGRSRAGMVIVAKGTEVHKSETFRVAAEAAGWRVSIHVEDYSDGSEEGATRHYADAHRDGEAIQLAWDGRAYDYPSSSARIGGKDRKVRNLKEALRLLTA